MLKILKCERCLPSLRLAKKITCSARSYGDDKDDDERKKKASVKLQELLSKLAKESTSDKAKVKEAPHKPIKLARPAKRTIENRPVYKVKLDKIADKHTVKLVTAVKDVADHVGGTPEQVKSTEAELLHVILNNKRPEGKSAEELQLANVISGMSVEKNEETRAESVRRNLPPERRQRTTFSRERNTRVATTGLNLFGEEPLGIFSQDITSAEQPFEVPVWSRLASKDLQLQVTHPPTNIYEEMIRWTRRGQLWTFPIDNEQGLDEEKAIEFTEHVFLDEHIESWCPTRGPLRRFMELVLIGLSKNPYITVEAKIEHINWFRDYFESKKKILQETGSLPDELQRNQVPAS